MNPDELLGRHKAVIPEWISLYYDKPMELARGEGFKVWDSEGNEYLDFFGGIVTTISGHNVPEIVEAVQKQSEKIFHSSTLYLIENQVKLAEKLVSLSPMSGDQKVFFTVSGTEANEAALLFSSVYPRFERGPGSSFVLPRALFCDDGGHGTGVVAADGPLAAGRFLRGEPLPVPVQVL